MPCGNVWVTSFVAGVPSGYEYMCWGSGDDDSGGGGGGDTQATIWRRIVIVRCFFRRRADNPGLQSWRHIRNCGRRHRGIIGRIVCAHHQPQPRLEQRRTQYRISAV